MQLATNTGGLVAIPFELLPPSIELTGSFDFELPRLPFDFVLKDATFAATLCTLVSDGLSTLAEMNHSTTPMVAQISNTDMGVNGCQPMSIVSAENKVLGGNPLLLTTTFTKRPASGGGSAFGLTLWLRGVWA